MPRSQATAWNRSIVIVRCPQARSATRTRFPVAPQNIGLAIALRAARAGANVAPPRRRRNRMRSSGHDLYCGRADRRPLECCLWDRRWHPSRAERRPAVPPIKVRRRSGSSLSERGSQVLVAGHSLPAHFIESIHKENLYGSSRSTFAAGVFGPAPMPTLKLSLVDCEIWYPRPKLKVP